MPTHNYNISSSQCLIEYAKHLLEKIDQAVSTHVPEDKSTKKKVEEIQKEVKDALMELGTPTLRLAFVGATSSGKSTLVNSLLGHYLLPMDTQEMSAGIVRIRHEDMRKNIHFMLDAPKMNGKAVKDKERYWEGADRDAEIAEDVYDTLRKCMTLFHKRKSETPAPSAPNAEIQCCTHLGMEKELLGLPEGIRLEILDLPGIREVNDPENMKSVQEVIKSSVLTLVLNYQDTAEERLQGLLDEIKETVQKFNGNTNMLLLVVNKVDTWNQQDGPLMDRLKNAQNKIKVTLALNEDPIVIPMSAIQYMLSLLSLGKIGRKNIRKEQAVALLAQMLNSHSVKLNDRWYRQLQFCGQDVYGEIEARLNGKDCELPQEQLDEAKNELQTLIDSDEEHKKMILAAASSKSGIDEYLRLLHGRIQFNFHHLVLLPAIQTKLSKIEDSLKKLRGEAKIRIEDCAENLRRFLEDLERSQKAVKKHLTNANRCMMEEKERVIRGLSSPSAQDVANVRRYLKNEAKYLGNMEKMFHIIDDVKGRVARQVTPAVKKFLEGGSASELQSALRSCQANSRNELINALTNLREHFQRYCAHIQWNDDDANRRKIEEVCSHYQMSQDALRNVYFSCLTTELQGKAQGLEKILLEAVQHIRTEILDCLASGKLDGQMSESLVPAIGMIQNNVKLDFDFNLMPFPEGRRWMQDTVTRKEKVIRTWKGFFANLFGANNPRSMTVYHTDKYIKFNLGTVDEFVANQERELNDVAPMLSDAIGGWFVARSEDVMKIIAQNMEESAQNYQKVCEEQAAKSSQETRAKQMVWKNYQANLERAHNEEELWDKNSSKYATFMGELYRLLRAGIVSNRDFVDRFNNSADQTSAAASREVKEEDVL